jgi:hypothetical protein
MHSQTVVSVLARFPDRKFAFEPNTKADRAQLCRQTGIHDLDIVWSWPPCSPNYVPYVPGKRKNNFAEIKFVEPLGVTRKSNEPVLLSGVTFQSEVKPKKENQEAGNNMSLEKKLDAISELLVQSSIRDELVSNDLDKMDDKIATLHGSLAAKESIIEKQQRDIAELLQTVRSLTDALDFQVSNVRALTSTVGLLRSDLTSLKKKVDDGNTWSDFMTKEMTETVKPEIKAFPKVNPSSPTPKVELTIVSEDEFSAKEIKPVPLPKKCEKCNGDCPSFFCHEKKMIHCISKVEDHWYDLGRHGIIPTKHSDCKLCAGRILKLKSAP